MSKYKKSMFNVAKPQTNGDVILYNSRTGAIIVLSKSAYAHYENESLSDISTLLKHGFMVETTTDELAEVAKLRKSAIEDNQGIFRVTIATTMACNARCKYCFEQNAPVHTMNEDTIEQTINFIREQSAGKNVAVHWFGGEPFLRPDIIDKITKELKSTIGDKIYFASVATNASLITDDIVSKLKEWSIDFVQVTIDGTEDEYLKRKAYVDNDPNHYKRVIENIEHMLQAGVYVKVRINFDKENVESAKKLIWELTKRFKPKYNRFAVYVFPLLGDCNNPVLYKAEELQEPLRELYFELFKAGYIKNFSDLNLNPRKIHCGARKPNSFNIDPLGNLYKCEHHVGRPEHSVGNVFTGVCNNELYAYWVNPEVNKKCNTCKFLPVCQGGCAVNDGTSNAGSCSILMHNLEEFLDMAYEIYTKGESTDGRT